VRCVLGKCHAMKSELKEKLLDMDPYEM
jgi:hypothetical protein